GPFHDDYPVHGANVKTVLAALAWFFVLVFFWLIRRKTRWPIFAIVWFLVAHIIESTVVPLELYFEHRNYLAIAGPLLASIVLVAQWAARNRGRESLAIAMAAIYAISLSFVLWQVASIFGQDEVAARLWHER